jgi:hypothetical protein
MGIVPSRLGKNIVMVGSSNKDGPLDAAQHYPMSKALADGVTRCVAVHAGSISPVGVSWHITPPLAGHNRIPSNAG